MSDSPPSTNDLSTHKIDKPPKNNKPKKLKKRKRTSTYKKFMKSALLPKLKKPKPFALPKAVQFKKIDKI